MTPGHKTSSLRELEDLFERALALPEAARAAFLDEACPDTEIRAQLDRMLASDTAEGFLDSPIVARLSLGDPGQTVGRWRLLDRIGEGGTGVVYRAETTQDGVELEAAVKILRPGLDTGFLRDRFNSERQILAGLDHPGIARFIDCGADEAGRSFLAMEYVHGESVGFYLSAHPGLSDRVRLFEQVADAVRYLHSRLVAHGDLKPANILMSDSGIPKLLDFGGARLLAPGTQAGELTRMMLTPAYASPEQKRGEGPSTVGDIYSLGRLLEEVLPGNAPADLRIVARHCQAEDPSGRYGSVAELLEDIRRWREGFPVRARRATAWYTLGRFVRRQWAVLMLTGSLIGALGYGWAVARQGEQRARELAAEAQRQAALARNSADDARQSATQARMSSEEAQRQRQRADAEAKAALDTAARYGGLVQQLVNSHESKAETAFLDQPALEKAIQGVIAELERTPGPRRVADLAAAWRRLASSRGFQGKFPLALEAAKHSVALSREAWKQEPTRDNHVRYVRALFDSPRYYLARGDFDALALALGPAMAELAKLPPEDQEQFAGSDVVLLERLRQAEARRDAPELERLLAAAEHYAVAPARQSALSFLLRHHAAAGNRGRVTDLCEEARLHGLMGPAFRESCPQSNGPLRLTEAQRVRLETRVEESQRWLRRYPASAEARRVLLRGLGPLISHHFHTGNARLARDLFDQAEAHMAEIRAADPESPVVRRLSAQGQAVRALLFGK